MHKLDRAISYPPACLSSHDYNLQKWSDLAPSCKSALRAALVQMQGQPDVTTPEANEYGLRCAYCEGAIFHEGHIEHFRRKNKNHFPELTFDWSNLFLACGSQEHCGHYKDRPDAQLYDPNHLVKPDAHDPDHYLYFHSSGGVRPRTGLNEDDSRRAMETIRVFGLDNSALSGIRRQVLTVYKKKILADLEVMAEWSEEDRNDYLNDEIEATCWEPYSTTIKHFLQD